MKITRFTIVFLASPVFASSLRLENAIKEWQNTQARSFVLGSLQHQFVLEFGESKQRLLRTVRDFSKRVAFFNKYSNSAIDGELARTLCSQKFLKRIPGPRAEDDLFYEIFYMYAHAQTMLWANYAKKCDMK